MQLGKFIRKATCLGVLCLAAPLAAHAQTFPTKPLTMVIPFPPGGSTDLVGRMLAKSMGEKLGQPAIVENQGGAGGAIGTQRVVRSTPDGHTLVFTVAGPVTLIPVVNKNITYSMADLEPIAIVFRSPFLLVVSADSKYQTLAQLLADGKAGANKVPAYGSSGIGAVSHVTSEIINAKAGTSFLHVPYKGTPGTMQAILAGDVQWGLVTGVDGKGYIDGGRFRALSQLSKDRSTAYPQIPTMKEAGIDIDSDVWYGLFAPKGTPKATLEKLRSTVRETLADPAFANRVKEMGGDVPTDANTPETILPRLIKERDEFQKIVKSLNIGPN